VWIAAKVLLLIGLAAPLALVAWILTIQPQPNGIAPGDALWFVVALALVLSSSAGALAGSFALSAVSVRRGLAPRRARSWLLLVPSLLGTLVMGCALAAYMSALMGWW
jgi:hypothetical protein